MKSSASLAAIRGRFLLVPLLVWGMLGFLPCMSVQGQDDFQEDVEVEGFEEDQAEGAVTERRQFGLSQGSKLGVTGRTYKGSRGAFVTDVLENSKAEEIGLEQGDVIVGVHVRGAWKKKVYTFEDLKQLLSRANGQLRLYVRDCNTGNYVWTSSTRFRGRLAGNVVRSFAVEGAESAEEGEFSEDDFQPGDAGEVEESAEDGFGGESL
jgi:hypothetical protein